MYKRGCIDLTDRQFVTGKTVEAEWQVETHKNLEILKDGKQSKTFLTTASYKGELNLDFLAAASESYHISPNPEDYIIVSLPIVTVDVPNRNLQAFPLEEVAYFDPKHGRMVYETFKHKPTHKDHVNQDPTKALGAHIDSSLHYIPQYDIWKISVLTMWDRTKDVEMVKDIISGKRTGYSMGAFVDAFQCSICGALDVNVNPCEHFDPSRGSIPHGGSIWGDTRRLAYMNCLGVTYFETSTVASPADSSAHSSDVFI